MKRIRLTLAVSILFVVAGFATAAKPGSYPFTIPADKAFAKLASLDGAAKPTFVPIKELSFADQCLVASGITDAEKRKSFLAKLDEIEKAARKAVDDAKSPREKAERLLKFLHDGPMAAGYEASQTDLGLLDTYGGLTVPLIASATATFLFRQFFLTIPDELAEAARIDGAGPMRFFFDIVMPLSRPNIAALFVILFIYGWNQYLWPLLITTNEDMYTVAIGIKRMINAAEATEWNLVLSTALLAMLPPVAVVLLMQKWFVKGLVDTEK